MIISRQGKSTETLFNKESLAWLVVIVTAFLQLISLMTTFNGSIVYFGGINLPLGISAPLLFALAIQLTVFAVSHTIRHQFNNGLIIVLLLATLCSTYFSYIGIYNYINSPINYLAERYEMIEQNLTDKYEKLREDNKGTMRENMALIINEIRTSHETLEMKITSNEQQSNRLATINVDDNNIKSQTNTVAKPDINNYGNDLASYYADMAKYNEAIGNIISDSTSQTADLKNKLYNSQVESILGGKTEEQFTKESIDTKTKKEQLDKGIDNIYSTIYSAEGNISFDDKLNKIQEFCQGIIAGDKDEKGIFSTVLINLNSQIEVVDKSLKVDDLDKKVNEFLLLNKKDNKLMLSLDDVEAKAYGESNGKNLSSNAVLSQNDAMVLYADMESEIKSAAYLLNGMYDEENKINLQDEEYEIDNLYVLPIYNLVKANEGRSMAWFCLLFAMLVDGLTLIFVIMEGRERTPLFAKNNKQVVGKSKEAIEELLMTTILVNDTESKDEERVKKSLVRLKEFMQHFKIMPKTIYAGYSMYCNINDLGDYHNFLAILCQFNLANIVKSSELFNEEPMENNDENLVLIKSKFVIWVNDKIVSLTLNAQYIGSIEEKEDGYLAKGVVY